MSDGIILKYHEKEREEPEDVANSEDSSRRCLRTPGDNSCQSARVARV